MVHKSLKKHLKNICVGNFYNYSVFEIENGGESYLEAVPLTPRCVTRIALDETELIKLLNRDILHINNFFSKVR